MASLGWQKKSPDSDEYFPGRPHRRPLLRRKLEFVLATEDLAYLLFEVLVKAQADVGLIRSQNGVPPRPRAAGRDRQAAASISRNAVLSSTAKG
jgi:hypothetical protein